MRHTDFNTRSPRSAQSSNQGLLGQIKNFFTSLTRLILVINILACVVLFFLVWWGLPQFLRLDHTEVVAFHVPAQQQSIIGYYSTGDSLPELFILSDQIAATTYEQEQKLLALSLVTDVVVESATELPHTDTTFTTNSSSRWKYYWQNLQQYSVSDWRRILLLHIALNKQRTVHTDAQLPDIRTFLERNPVVNRDTAYACPVAVVNTTQTSGLAKKVSELLERSGVVVVRIDDTQDNRADSSISTKGDTLDSCQAVVQKLSVFAEDIAENTELNTQYRSELVLLLGENVQITTQD